MTITRVTQNMMMKSSMGSLQTGLNRLSKNQEQLSTGRVLNRPSDSPTDTTSAMRLRAEMADQSQYARNAEDGAGWLNQIDTTLTSMIGQVTRARDLGIQGVNGLSQTPQAREALATEIDQIRESLISGANSSYLGRPVFGGLVNGKQAYDASGTYVGVPGEVKRTIGLGVKVAVNADGPTVFGPPGSDVFADLADLSTALRAGNTAGVQAAIGSLNDDHSRITATLSDVGTRSNRVDRAIQSSKDALLDLTSSLSQIENVDLARATIDLKLNEVAYQAALSATARLVQPSLSDFLR